MRLLHTQVKLYCILPKDLKFSVTPSDFDPLTLFFSFINEIFVCLVRTSKG